MNKDAEIKLSKLLSYVLRHDPAHAGIELDSAGWVDIDILLDGLNARGDKISREELEIIVKNSDKQRFAISENGDRIRSNQGHSIDVELGYQPAEPPEILYHGTATRFLDAIRKEGLTRQSRHHVHLSAVRETADTVGKRHGKPTILVIKARQMQENGHQFFISTNGVWLTDHVPVAFIEFQS